MPVVAPIPSSVTPTADVEVERVVIVADAVDR
jgi:hypothetical protein